MDDAKINQNRQKKIDTVGQFEEKVKRAKAIVLTDYRGLTHQQLETLKKGLKATEAELVVTKNTLLKRALEQGKSGKGKGESEDLTLNASPSAFDGPTATLFAYNDIVAPLKELAKMIKSLKMPTVKLGFVEGKMITGQEVLKLSTLPSREVLIAQVVGGMKSPIYGLHRALNWNITKLVMTLSAIQQKKS